MEVRNSSVSFFFQSPKWGYNSTFQLVTKYHEPPTVYNTHLDQFHVPSFFSNPATLAPAFTFTSTADGKKSAPKKKGKAVGAGDNGII